MRDRRNVRRGLWTLVLLSACGGGTPSPTGPSEPMSFLAGTWHGTTTIQVNPGDPDVPQPSTGAMTWTFEVVPQTNRQTFRATIQSQHAWLPATVLIGSATLTPSNTAPANIGTQGSYASPRGCQATFGSFGIAQVSRIEADFSGVDCDHTTFTGRVVLAKD